MPVLFILVGMVIGMVITGFIIATSVYTLGEDSYLKPKLIEMQCAEYNQTSGDFELRNLLKESK
jgi:hypothetical protein